MDPTLDRSLARSLAGRSFARSLARRTAVAPHDASSVECARLRRIAEDAHYRRGRPRAMREESSAAGRLFPWLPGVSFSVRSIARRQTDSSRRRATSVVNTPARALCRMRARASVRARARARLLAATPLSRRNMSTLHEGRGRMDQSGASRDGVNGGDGGAKAENRLQNAI